MPKRTAFTTSTFILTEGEEDAAFLRALIQARNLQVTGEISPIADVFPFGGPRGKDAFGRAIATFAAKNGFNQVSKIVIVADNDDVPKDSFDSICAQIELARSQGALTRNWAKPNAAGQIASGSPDVLVWMWPQPGVPGCLETMLWPIIQAVYPAETACVQAAFNCSGANSWPISKLHKGYVRCFFSIACRKSPGITLASIWNMPATSDLVPVNHSLLDPVAAAIAGF